MKHFFLLASLLVCANISAQNWNGWQTSNVLGSYTSKKDVSYVNDNNVYHKLDIYYPNNVEGKCPVIIHIYGSAWMMNDYKGSADLGTVGETALKNGYIFVTPNHRSCNDATFPAQLNDIKAVVRYLRGNAEELKIDTSFIGISGFSSGGHLASLMGTTRNEKVGQKGNASFDLEGTLGDYTDFSSSVDAVCNWSGPICLTVEEGCGLIMNSNGSYEKSEMGCDAQGNEDKYALATAITYIDPTDPPFLTVHGSKDNIVPQCQGKRFNEALKAGGVESEFIGTDGDHGVYSGALDQMLQFFNNAKEKKAASSDPATIHKTPDESMRIFQNGGEIKLIGVPEGTEFKLIDILGKTLFNGVVGSDAIDVNSLKEGIYFIALFRNNEWNTSKIQIHKK